MNNRYFWISSVLSSITMAFVMSGIMSAYQIGLEHHWLSAWFQSFALSWPTALILNITVLPHIRKLANKLTQISLKPVNKSRAE